jgi:hypothetical protein
LHNRNDYTKKSISKIQKLPAISYRRQFFGKISVKSDLQQITSTSREEYQTFASGRSVLSNSVNPEMLSQVDRVSRTKTMGAEKM